MIEKFYPDEYVESIHHIDYEKLSRRGIKNLIFDIDNTIEPYDVARPTKRSLELIRRLCGMGFLLLLVSNNSKKRVDSFNESLRLNAVSRAKKPLKSAVLRIMEKVKAEKDATVFIGDQVFTDVWCARRLGIYSILVKPIAERDEISVRWKRGLERIVLNSYGRR